MSSQPKKTTATKTKVAEGIYRYEPTGTYFYQFSVTGPDGRRRQYLKRGFPTMKAAQKARREALRSHDKGGPVVEPSKEATAVYLRRWLEAHRSEVRAGTWRRDRIDIESNIIPVIGHVPLCYLTADHVDQMMAAMEARGAAPATVNRARATLHTALAPAVKRQRIMANPVSMTERRKVERPKQVVPDGAGLRALQAAAEGTPWEIAMLVATTTGARRGEVLGVCWRDLDLDRGRVTFTRALQRIDGKGLCLVDLKTARSRRTVALVPSAAARLRAWRLEQAEALLALGVRQTPETPVCTNAAGEVFDPDAFTHAASRFARRVGLAGARLHDSRHGVATQLLAQGVHPGIASAVLGHTDPGFTLRTYSHVLDGMTDVAAEAMERALGGSGGSV